MKKYRTPKVVNIAQEIEPMGNDGESHPAVYYVARAAAKALKGGIDLTAEDKPLRTLQDKQ